MAQSPVPTLHAARSVASSHRGMVLNAVSWVLFALVVCTLVARLATKLSAKTNQPRFGLDDLFIALATLFSLGQTIAVSVEATHALGQHFRDLSPSQVELFQKAEYAACILYIANMGCARLSICLVIRKLLPGLVARYTVLVFAGLTAIWTIIGILVNAFACHLPTPWKFMDFQNCYNVVAFVNYVGITNIVVDVLLVIIPLFIWNVRLSAGKRVSVSLVFLARLSIVGAISAQLYFFNSSKLDDLPYDSWATVLCQQIAQNLSVITACLPCLHPFIVSILVGTTVPETVKLNYGAPPWIRQYLDREPDKLDSISSWSSNTSTYRCTGNGDEPYCRPLATYGLDLSSTHAHSQSMNRIPVNTANKVRTAAPPENFFNRLIEVPRSRPVTASSNGNPVEIPKNLGEVGVLPIIEWDSDSVSSSCSRRSTPSPTREPTAEYIFDRSKVISIPEERHLYDDGVKQFAPPLPSPRTPQKPPRAF